MNRVKKKSIGDKLGVIYAVLLFAFIYIPTVIMVVYSFNQQPSNKWWTGFTTEWYGKLFRDAQLWQSFGLSLKISLLSTLIVVIIGTLGAMGLTRYRFFGRNALTYSVYLPMIVPGVVFAVPLMALLVLMGLKKGFWAVVLGNVILMLPYMILTVRTRFLGLDRSVEEASMDLGASGVETFFRITLPLLSPTTLFLLVTTFLSSMKVFQSVDILTSGGPARSTEVFVYLIYRYAMVDFRMDRAATAAVMFFLILLVITVLTMKVSDRSVTYDS